MRSSISRRNFLKASAVTVLGAAVAACAQPTPTAVPTKPAAAPTNTPVPPAPTAKPAEPTKPAVVAPTAAPTAIPPTAAPTKPPAPTYKEAPALAELVKAGKLPPVDQRLPIEPLVLKPVEKIGKYGGKWTFMSTSTTWGGGNDIAMANWCENMARWERDTSGHRPNVITKWAWNADGTQITLTFRKGMKWSNGDPLGPDDWLFWYNDMVLDEKVKAAKQTGLSTGGVDAKAEKLDDVTIRLTFSKPNPLFIELMNRGVGLRATSWQICPSKYLKQFHYKYTPAATDVKVLLDHYELRQTFPDMPHDGPWIVKEQKPGVSILLERNPYYWKVDTEGNQLPYMDQMECKSVKDANLISLSGVAGELDFQLRGIALKDTALFKENEVKGKYQVRMWKLGDANQAGILYHYCHPDKKVTAVMFNRKFRQAMSYAINKARINDIVFMGLGQVRGFAMMADGPEFASARGQKVLKDWENSCIEYDPAKAKALLDEIGMKDVNNDGWRELPDGTLFDPIIDVDITDKYGTEANQLFKEDFKAVGLKWTMNVIDATTLEQRYWECVTPFRARGAAASGLFIAPGHWAPVEDTSYTIAGGPYGRWYQSGGKLGTAPPAEAPWMKKLMDIYGEAILIVDTAKRHDRTLDGYQVHIDEGPFQIGTVGSLLSPVIVKNTLKNVTKSGIIGSWVFGFPGTIDPEQWFQE